MSTDYYWRRNHCGCCNRYDKIHVFGTGMLFRAYTDDPTQTAEPAFPLPFPATSVRAWRRLWRVGGGSLWDEYGRMLDMDTFLAELAPGPINWGEQAGMNAFQDDEGFWLTYQDFGGPHT
jgi:hypothetical protein